MTLVPLDRGVTIVFVLVLLLLVPHVMPTSALDFAHLEHIVDLITHASPLHMILTMESHAPLDHMSTVLANSYATSPPLHVSISPSLVNRVPPLSYVVVLLIVTLEVHLHAFLSSLNPLEELANPPMNANPSYIVMLQGHTLSLEHVNQVSTLPLMCAPPLLTVLPA